MPLQSPNKHSTFDKSHDALAYSYEDSGERARVLRGAQNIVVKVGTQLLTDDSTGTQQEHTARIIGQVAALRKAGCSVILVSSGAIGAGMNVLHTGRRPDNLDQLQAHAAVGQSQLMYQYENECVQHGFHCGQILLTASDVRDRQRQVNITSCLRALLDKGVLPIINENDSVSVDEIKFTDNDILAALVATMVKADLTILLTTVDGMQEITGPEYSGTGKRISVVHRVTPALRTMAGGPAANQRSTGGMTTKLRAAETVTRAGDPLWIADGQHVDILPAIMNGEDTGTLFLPANPQRMTGRKRYLAFFSITSGTLVIDDGAAEALTTGGRSLLPSGIIEVHGDFDQGANVRITNQKGHEIARGIVNHSSEQIERIRGKQSAEAQSTLGPESHVEVVHRDRMALTVE